MNTFRLHILAADRVFFEGDCTSLIVPTVHGQYGVQARHSNMIAALVPGQLTFRCPDAPERLAAVSAGMIKVEDNDVLVLVDAAERPEDIDAPAARPTRPGRFFCKRRAVRSTAPRRPPWPVP